MSTDYTHSLAATALFTAAVRARETAHADALFADPWAAQLAGDHGFAAADRLPPSAALWPVIRTRFLDDWLAQWRDAAPSLQIVLPAAGLDTRAYRLDWPAGTWLFEIDQLDVLAYKNRILTQVHAQPRCHRIALAHDLRLPWAHTLLQAGFKVQRPAIWIVEGLLMYLDTADVQHVMTMIAQLSAPGSYLGLDLATPSLQGFEVSDPNQWLRDLGWDATVSSLREVALQFDRWPSSSPSVAAPSTGAAHGRHVYLVAAQRHAEPGA